MTREECRAGLERLAKGWNVNITSEQLTAIHTKLQHVPNNVWQTAVDDLLANYLAPPRSGLLDHILKAVEYVQEDRRKATMRQERREADAMFHGKLPVVNFADPMELEYGQMRMKAISEGLQNGRCAETIRDRILEWLEVHEHAVWAIGQSMAHCSHADNPHTLLQCLSQEAQDWDDKAKRTPAAEASTNPRTRVLAKPLPFASPSGE